MRAACSSGALCAAIVLSCTAAHGLPLLEPLHLFNASNVGESYYATSPQEDGLQATDSGFDGFIAALLDGSDDPLLAIQYSTSAIGDSIGLRESRGGYFPAYGYSVLESVAFEDLTPAQIASIRTISHLAETR